ncbi:hypothetical protein [Streptomyces sp. NPDC005955]|uniref:hypothetical protein n=1 Tax=Streptomyces sp. NPDC005955 TaxID=3364738 RepID=UPI0036B05484
MGEKPDNGRRPQPNGGTPDDAHDDRWVTDRLDTGPRTGTGAGDTEGDGKRAWDLNVPQVAGSAVAAVVAAKLASNAGVYGTILGAGLVSVVVTCGGAVLQHFFTRTGEQIRGAAGQAKPRARQVPAGEGAPGVRDGYPPPGGYQERTRLLRTVDPRADRSPGTPAAGAEAPGAYGQGTVHRVRVRWWKRPLLAAALVFGVTMGGITAYELVAGESFGGGGGTTIGEAVTGGGNDGAPGPDRKDPSPGVPDERPTAPPGDGDATGDGSGDGNAGREDGGPDTGDAPSAPDSGSDDQQGDASPTAPEPGTGQDGGPAPEPSDGADADQEGGAGEQTPGGGSSPAPTPSQPPSGTAGAPGEGKQGGTPSP